jgi:hypothetical protein
LVNNITVAAIVTTICNLFASYHGMQLTAYNIINKIRAIHQFDINFAEITL